MNTRIRLAVLIAVSLALLSVTVALVPYRMEERYINRRTGAFTMVTTICLMIRKESANYSYVDLSSFGETTAPDEQLFVSRYVYPFPWSRVSMRSHWRSTTNMNHWWLSDVLKSAFCAAKDAQEIKSELTKEAYLALMAKRLELWNSVPVDDRLEKIVSELHNENERLFPMAFRGAVNTKTVVIPTKP